MTEIPSWEQDTQEIPVVPAERQPLLKRIGMAVLRGIEGYGRTQIPYGYGSMRMGVNPFPPEKPETKTKTGEE